VDDPEEPRPQVNPLWLVLHREDALDQRVLHGKLRALWVEESHRVAEQGRVVTAHDRLDCDVDAAPQQREKTLVAGTLQRRPRERRIQVSLFFDGGMQGGWQ
jgi:hypothetical protein